MRQMACSLPWAYSVPGDEDRFTGIYKGAWWRSEAMTWNIQDAVGA